MMLSFAPLIAAAALRRPAIDAAGPCAADSEPAFGPATSPMAVAHGREGKSLDDGQGTAGGAQGQRDPDDRTDRRAGAARPASPRPSPTSANGAGGSRSGFVESSAQLTAKRSGALAASSSSTHFDAYDAALQSVMSTYGSPIVRNAPDFSHFDLPPANWVTYQYYYYYVLLATANSSNGTSNGTSNSTSPQEYPSFWADVRQRLNISGAAFGRAVEASATAIQQHTVPNPQPDASAPAVDPNAYNWHWATPASGDVHYLWWGLKNYSKRKPLTGPVDEGCDVDFPKWKGDVSPYKCRGRCPGICVPTLNWTDYSGTLSKNPYVDTSPKVNYRVMMKCCTLRNISNDTYIYDPLLSRIRTLKAEGPFGANATCAPEGEQLVKASCTLVNRRSLQTYSTVAFANAQAATLPDSIVECETLGGVCRATSCCVRIANLSNPSCLNVTCPVPECGVGQRPVAAPGGPCCAYGCGPRPDVPAVEVPYAFSIPEYIPPSDPTPAPTDPALDFHYSHLDGMSAGLDPHLARLNNLSASLDEPGVS